MVNILVSIQDISQCVNYEEHTVYASLGETVILPFIDSRVSTLIWKRNENIIISDGSLINNNINEKERFKIIGDQTIGEYNLEISSITESDLGLYWCEFQIKNTAVQRKVVLNLADNKSTVVTDLYREQSTVKDEASPTYLSVTFKTYNTQSTTLLNAMSQKERLNITLFTYFTTVWCIYKRRLDIRGAFLLIQQALIKKWRFQQPVLTTRKTKTQERTENENKALQSLLLNNHVMHLHILTGFSSDEKFLFYGLVAGLVLVLCLSIVCNICINRKCRTENLTIKNNVPNVKNVVDFHEPSLEPEDGSSTYESICESEMLPFAIKVNTKSSIQQSFALEKKLQNNSPTSDKPYFEVIDDDNVYLNPCHTPEAQEQSDNLNKISSPEYEVALPETGTISCAGQSRNQSSDNDIKVKVQESSDINIKIQIDPADDITAKYSVGEDINECLKRHEVDEKNSLLVQKKENTESMTNFIELSETSSSDDNEERTTVQTGDDYINPYQTLKRSDKDDEHDYNICAVP
ncbi:unnamed protein product [Mytilus coruscus]|uniref:Ig-like domain-containing protein n=1 Tax=Mytilus coruscus TaxID=42192 RepID=A0A6J8CSQ6_MYTCO|nr:unnamed protein product [Mytilus coruscus]